MLTPTIIDLLRQLEPQLQKPKHFWTHEEIGKIYSIYNQYHGTNKPMTTCGACVSNTTQQVRKIYQEYKAQYGTHDS